MRIPGTQTHYLEDKTPQTFEVRKFKAGDQIGLLTLIEPDYRRNSYGRLVHRGYWINKCECGDTVIL